MRCHALIVAVLFAASAYGQCASNASPEGRPRRLEHVLWNPVERRVSWVVSEGSLDEKGEYVRDGTMRSYVIDFKDATMTHADETRSFEIEEAVDVGWLFDKIVTAYAQGSVVWWEEGKGKRRATPFRSSLGIAR